MCGPPSDFLLVDFFRSHLVSRRRSFSIDHGLPRDWQVFRSHGLRPQPVFHTMICIFGFRVEIVYAIAAGCCCDSPIFQPSGWPTLREPLPSVERDYIIRYFATQQIHNHKARNHFARILDGRLTALHGSSSITYNRLVQQGSPRVTGMMCLPPPTMSCLPPTVS